MTEKVRIFDLVNDKVVRFMYFREGNFIYECENGFQFPVGIDDIGTATLLSCDKAIYFMRWIRKHLKTIEEGNVLGLGGVSTEPLPKEQLHTIINDSNPRDQTPVEELGKLMIDKTTPFTMEGLVQHLIDDGIACPVPEETRIAAEFKRRGDAEERIGNSEELPHVPACDW